MKTALIYVHDPMCSWCWGFEPVRKQLFCAVEPDINIIRLVGGLAPDSNDPMPKEMQIFLQNTWRKIEQTVPGTSFNYDFWHQCQPRRSTYPANRAILAARLQGVEFDDLMTLRIQQAYYQEAKNPSDDDVLIELAGDIDLEVEQFKQDIHSTHVEKMLNEEIQHSRALGMNSFPSLAYQIGSKTFPITLDYNNVDSILKQIHDLDTNVS